jgi:hypothetical protein
MVVHNQIPMLSFRIAYMLSSLSGYPASKACPGWLSFVQGRERQMLGLPPATVSLDIPSDSNSLGNVKSGGGKNHEACI